MKYFIFLLLQTTLLNGFCQKLSLEQAIQLGLSNRAEVKNQRLQIKLATIDNQKLKAQWLPQLSGTIDFRWNTQLQTTVLPFDITGRNPGGTSQTQLGLPFNNSLGVQADQKLLDPTRPIDRKIFAKQVQNQEVLLEKEQLNIKQSITESYYLAVFQQEKLRFLEQQVDYYQTNVALAEQKLKNGTLLNNEVEKIYLDLSNAQISLTKAQQDYRLSIDALKYQINTQDNIGELSDGLEQILVTITQTDSLIQRPELKAERLLLEINGLNEIKQKKRILPTISAYGNYTVLQLASQFNPFQAGTWFPFNYVGIKANIPIFDGRQAKITASEYQIRQEINKNTLEKITADFNYELLTASKQLKQATLDLAQTQKNIDLAQKIVETDRLRFEKGSLLYSELKNTEFSLQNAANNHLSSIYNVLVASIKLKKAQGIL